MNNFLFENRTKFLFGGGCVKEYLASFLKGYGPSVLLVTGAGGEAEGPALEEVSRILRTGKKMVVECAIHSLCPGAGEAQQAARLCRENHVDLILGVGGGAVLDCCKATALAAVCRGDLWEDFWLRRGVVDRQPLPVGFVAAAIETGAASGAAGLLHEGRCIWRDYTQCDPKFVLMDPGYTQALPRTQLTAQAFSALAGALEYCLAPSEGAEVSRDMLETLLRGMIGNLRACLRDRKDDGARSDLMWACSQWGGRLFQLGRQSAFPALPVRAQALSLAAETGCGYADALAVLLLALCRQEAEQSPAVMARMARRVWELPCEGHTELQQARAGVDALADLLVELGLPTEPEQLDGALQTALRENPMVYTA